MPAARKRHLDPVAGESLTLPRWRHQLRLVGLERERRKHRVQRGEHVGGRRFFGAGGDGDAVEAAADAYLAAHDRDEAAAAPRPGRRRAKVGAFERDRERGTVLAGSEVADVQVHLPSSADCLPRERARIVLVRGKREVGGVEDASCVRADEDAGLPAREKLERKTEAGDSAPHLACGVDERTGQAGVGPNSRRGRAGVASKT